MPIRCCEEASGMKMVSLAAVMIFVKFHNFINLISVGENNEKCIRHHGSNLILCNIGVNGTTADTSAALTQ